MNKNHTIMHSSKTKDHTKYSALLLVFLHVLDVIAFPALQIAEKNTWRNPVHYSNLVEQQHDGNELVDLVEESYVRLPLPGGPDQPEVQGFTPIGLSDMVDPFTGDFNYNIPLLEVDGYPLNLGYSAGVTMEQEASWVGLGWNLNPGVLNRNLRGLPDDFNGEKGDQIHKKLNQKENKTLDFQLNVNLEFFGLNGDSMSPVKEWMRGKKLTLGVGAGAELSYNNMNGYSAGINLGLNFALKNSLKNTRLDAGLGLSGNSASGASVNSNLSFGQENSGKISMSGSINSLNGLQSRVSLQATLNAQKRDKAFSAVTSSTSFSTGNPRMYSPKINNPTGMLAMGASFKLGIDVLGLDGSGQVRVNYSSMWLKEKDVSTPAYGYFNLAAALSDKSAVIDFNRENDGIFTKNTPALPIPVFTNDIFSASGHGVNGSYKAYRNEIGYNYDPFTRTFSSNTSFDGEANFGSVVKNGIDVNLNFSQSKTGIMQDGNNLAMNNIGYKNDEIKFRESNEQAVDSKLNTLQSLGGSDPVKFAYGFYGFQGSLQKENGSSIFNYPKSDISESQRNQVMTKLTIKELKEGLGIQTLHPDSYAQNNDDLDHHVGQYTVLNKEGSRYIYGIAAFSHFQTNSTFAVSGGAPIDKQLAIKTYTPEENSVANPSGRDNFYQAETTPAYAHSYLLSAIINADYVDSDDIKGPSKGDLGGYVLFDYQKLDNYKWRSPIASGTYKSNYDEGLKVDNKDDKGSVIHGEKELWYIKEIRTKNHIAIFHTSARQDAPSISEHGVKNNNLSMQRLDSISLYSLPDYEANGAANATLIKRVHFVYDYSLCQNYPLNSGTGANSGKLTLLKVYFTYENSHKGRYSGYQFTYANNPNFQHQAQDRWGYYRQSVTGLGANEATNPLTNAEFPYVGNNKTQVDLDVAAWSLSTIKLPSGGKIKITYESDDYAHVQHLRAHQMFKIIGVSTNDNRSIQDADFSGEACVSKSSHKNARLYFELADLPNGTGKNTNIQSYIPFKKTVLFKTLTKMAEPNNGLADYEFVSGFAEMTNIGIETNGNNGPVGYIDFKPVKLRDSGESDFHPMALAGVQFARTNLNNFVPPSNSPNLSTIDPDTPGLLDAVVGAWSSFGGLLLGPNRALYNADIGNHIVLNKSWIRLQEPNEQKLGGGLRVKEIRISDGWDELVAGQEAYEYGQQYSYTTANGKSSGVATYEPMVGGDENVLKMPVAFDLERTMGTDDRNFQLTPFGEQYFPSPSVGYAMVTVRDLPRQGISRTATGKVVQEFYTARDFPTIALNTSVRPPALAKIRLIGFFVNFVEESQLASQGFMVELNDMHGKPKGTSVYAEGQSEPISATFYRYKHRKETKDGVPIMRLVNTVNTIDKNGNQATRDVGMNFDMLGDFRESKSSSISTTFDFNLNIIPFVPVPVGFPTFNTERTRFRSAVMLKLIERFGIQDSVIAQDAGSVVTTQNLAYDAATGAVLVTKTHTNFKDAVYNLSIPAHWYYDRMGPAHRNIDFTKNFVQFVSGKTSQITSNDLVEGDELALYNTGGGIEFGWVVESATNGIKVVTKNGSEVQGNFLLVKLLRSGRRNLSDTPIATITSRKDPRAGLKSGIYETVLQAGATEYNDEWRTFCDCFRDEGFYSYTSNPFVLGIRGTFRPVSSFVHLSGRDQTFEQENSNIRNDGFMTSFTPFYKLQNNRWKIDRQNWTYTSSVEDFSPFGQALETKDALNRYTSSLFGYNQTLAKAVAVNTRYHQLGFDGFEDYNFNNCSDEHFKLSPNLNISTAEAHTGKKSMLVKHNDLVTYSVPLAQTEICEKKACNIDFDATHDYANGASTYTFQFKNGVAPYQVDFNLISGNGDYSFDEQGRLKISTTNSAKVKLIITDAKDCQRVLNYTLTIPQQ